MGAMGMGGRFGSVESEMEVESRHPVHRDEPPRGFRDKQFLLGAVIVAVAVGIWALSMFVR